MFFKRLSSCVFKFRLINTYLSFQNTDHKMYYLNDYVILTEYVPTYTRHCLKGVQDKEMGCKKPPELKYSVAKGTILGETIQCYCNTDDCNAAGHMTSSYIIITLAILFSGIFYVFG